MYMKICFRYFSKELICEFFHLVCSSVEVRGQEVSCRRFTLFSFTFLDFFHTTVGTVPTVFSVFKKNPFFQHHHVLL